MLNAIEYCFPSTKLVLIDILLSPLPLSAVPRDGGEKLPVLRKRVLRVLAASPWVSPPSVCCLAIVIGVSPDRHPLVHSSRCDAERLLWRQRQQQRQCQRQRVDPGRSGRSSGRRTWRARQQTRINTDTSELASSHSSSNNSSDDGGGPSIRCSRHRRRRRRCTHGLDLG